LGENPDEYNRLERHLEKNHFELSDLENRRSYSLLALAQETKLVVHVTGELGIREIFPGCIKNIIPKCSRRKIYLGLIKKTF